MDSLLIADPHPVARAGIRALLQQEFSFKPVAEVANGLDTLLALDQGQWNLLLLDLQLPGMSGFDVLDRVVGNHPAVKVLVLSGLPESIYARQVLGAGAWGFVPKGSLPAELNVAVRLMIEGQHYFSSYLLQTLTAGLGDLTGPAEFAGQLSAREFRVLRFLAAGRNAAQIAERLGVSVQTIRGDRRQILRKMDLGSQADLTAYALRHQIC